MYNVPPFNFVRCFYVVVLLAMTIALFAYTHKYFIFHMTISISKDLWNVKECINEKISKY